MRRFARATATFAIVAPLGLGSPAAAEPDPEVAGPAAPPEKAAPVVPPPAAEPADDVPPFEAPDPPDISVIDPTNPPDQTKGPTPSELEEKAKREAVGRQTDQLRKQSAQGAGKEYFGGGIY